MPDLCCQLICCREALLNELQSTSSEKGTAGGNIIHRLVPRPDPARIDKVSLHFIMVSLANQRQLGLAISMVSAICLLALGVHYQSISTLSAATELNQVPAQVSLSQLKARNLQLKKEVARASAFLKSLRHPARATTLQALEHRNEEMQDEINQVRLQHAEEEHAILKKELMQARQMSYSTFNPMTGQALAWKDPRALYAKKEDGFNPLSVVTRADKSLDPNKRPPLRVNF